MECFRHCSEGMKPTLAYCLLGLLSSVPIGEAQPARRTEPPPSIPLRFLRFFPVRDTIYTLSRWYLVLDLAQQRLRLYGREGEQQEFPVSSGTTRIPKGIETPTGLFTLQTKATLAISRQFENTPMLYWMGFFGNIGFHALEGWGYYRHLGRRPSSHGCVRLSREDAQYLYRLLPRGTPVLVQKDEPARVLAFLKPEEFSPGHDWLLRSGGYEQELLLRRRLERLYAGKARASAVHRLVLDGSTILRPGGYAIGTAREIPPQEPPLLLGGSSLDFHSAARVNTAVELPTLDTLTAGESSLP
jgi:hypothetical protein